jgi:hypothetical protein
VAKFHRRVSLIDAFPAADEHPFRSLIPDRPRCEASGVTDLDTGSTPMRGQDVLISVDLVRPDERGGDTPPLIRESTVSCGRPLAYPIPPAELPPFLRSRAEAMHRRYHGVLFAFDLGELPEGLRYSRVRIEASLSGDDAIAVQLHADGDALGLLYGDELPQPASAVAARVLAAAPARPGWLARLASRSGQPRAWVAGQQSSVFSWTYENPRGSVTLPRTIAVHAVVETPAQLSTLDGALSVQVGVVGPGRPNGPAAGMREAVPFGVALSGPEDRSAEPPQAQVRLCVAADVEKYSRRRNDLAELIQSRLAEVLARARRHAGLAEASIERQVQGDEEFTILPAGIDESTVIPRLVAGLAAGLRELNRDVSGDVRMRLRVALHRGLVKQGATGWVGQAPIAVHRILNSAPLRAALANNPGVDFVLGVPDVLYDDVVSHSYEDLDAEDFAPISIDMPDKGFQAHAWLYVPGA